MIQILDSGLYEPRTTTLHETPKPEAVWAHEEDRMNAFGLVVMDGDPVICGHGGSMWLCRGCARNIAIETGRESGIDRYFREQKEPTEVVDRNGFVCIGPEASGISEHHD